MFDRSNGGYAPEPSSISVEVAVAEGTIAKGRLFVAMGKTLADVLNGTAGFLEFEPFGGERMFLAKSQLASIKPLGIPRAPNLGQRSSDPSGIDPYAVLGLAAGADREEIRQAYVRLAKAYHPDRYTTVELPEEVRAYLAVMARRINAAHRCSRRTAQTAGGARRTRFQLSGSLSAGAGLVPAGPAGALTRPIPRRP